jgi:hypothetical protein
MYTSIQKRIGVFSYPEENTVYHLCVTCIPSRRDCLLSHFLTLSLRRSLSLSLGLCSSCGRDSGKYTCPSRKYCSFLICMKLYVTYTRLTQSASRYTRFTRFAYVRMAICLEHKFPKLSNERSDIEFSGWIKISIINRASRHQSDTLS